MSAKRKDIAPELIEEARLLYETTDTPTDVIAAKLDIARGTLNERIRKWGWTRRGYAKADEVELPAAIARVPDAPQLPEETALPFATRIRRVIDAQLSVAERMLKVLEPTTSAQAERTARVLATVSRTILEIKAAAEEQMSANDADNDPVSVDMDEFRETLARRIRFFADARRRGAGLGGDEVRAEPEGMGT